MADEVSFSPVVFAIFAGFIVSVVIYFFNCVSKSISEISSDEKVQRKRKNCVFCVFKS